MAACRSLARQCALHLRPSLRSFARPARQCLARGNPPLRRAYATSVAAADLQFGQPLHETHPHLLSPGERMTTRLLRSLSELN
jgi:intermediate cleaving peptidase 55